MADSEHCQNHPENEVTARCVRFNRRFCGLDFEDRENPPECLSAGTYCEYRSQCTVWAKLRELKLKKRAEAQSATASASRALD